MDIQNKTVLVLGGFGLVGNAVIRKIMPEQPKQIIVTSLFQNEAEEQCKKLQEHYNKPDDYFVPFWGNIFVRNEYKDRNRFELLNNKDTRHVLMKDIMEEMTDEILKSSTIYKMLDDYKPDVIIDCINSATGIAYQDVYTTYRTIKKTIANNPSVEDLATETEKLICTMYIPQLIRHIQILYKGMADAGTKVYVKIGTSGTGGMGLNIPYTHSEEKPSRVLLSKSCVAGAHTLLLFLMGRTPEGAITKEIKPTAAIAWKKITFGEIKKRGKAIEVVDVNLDEALPLEDKLRFKIEEPFRTTGEKLKSVFIDTGENGTFSRGEFEAITTQGQMEYVTPEEIAVDAIREIKGGNTGHDIINALDNATLEPSYRAGFLQHSAVEKLAELEEIHNVSSVAFELLGPPRLSKLLFEIEILKRLYTNMKDIVLQTPESMSMKAFEYVAGESKFRNEILSIGIPILLPDGKAFLRGNEMKIPPYRGEDELDVTPDNINLWCHDGWVDLRAQNMEFWIGRLNHIIEKTGKIEDDDTSSMHVRTKKYWNNFEAIDIGKVVGYLFIEEERGERMKS